MNFTLVSVGYYENWQFLHILSSFIFIGCHVLCDVWSCGNEKVNIFATLTYTDYLNQVSIHMEQQHFCFEHIQVKKKYDWIHQIPTNHKPFFNLFGNFKVFVLISAFFWRKNEIQFWDSTTRNNIYTFL